MLRAAPAAEVIAGFCRSHLPETWVPPAPEVCALQALICRQARLEEMLCEETNRMGARNELSLERSLREHVRYLKADVLRVTEEINTLLAQHPPLREQRGLIATTQEIAALMASRILRASRARLSREPKTALLFN